MGYKIRYGASMYSGALASGIFNNAEAKISFARNVQKEKLAQSARSLDLKEARDIASAENARAGRDLARDQMDFARSEAQANREYQTKKDEILRIANLDAQDDLDEKKALITANNLRNEQNSFNKAGGQIWDGKEFDKTKQYVQTGQDGIEYIFNIPQKEKKSSFTSSQSLASINNINKLKGVKLKEGDTYDSSKYYIQTHTNGDNYKIPITTKKTKIDETSFDLAEQNIKRFDNVIPNNFSISLDNLSNLDIKSLVEKDWGTMEDNNKEMLTDHQNNLKKINDKYSSKELKNAKFKLIQQIENIKESNEDKDVKPYQEALNNFKNVYKREQLKNESEKVKLSFRKDPKNYKAMGAMFSYANSLKNPIYKQFVFDKFYNPIKNAKNIQERTKIANHFYGSLQSMEDSK